MKHSEKEKKNAGALLDFEDEVTARIENGLEPEVEELPADPVVEPADAPVEDAAPEAVIEVESDAPIAKAPEVVPEVSPAVEEAPVPEAPAEPAIEEVVEDRPEPQYGAPQPLFEDLIPANFANDEEQRRAAEERAEQVAAEAAAREAKEAEAARKKQEKEEAAARKKAAKEAKRQAKEDKKKAKTRALIDKTEAAAEAQAIRDIEKETGEHYEMPKADEAPAEGAADAAIVPVVVPDGEAPAEERVDVPSATDAPAQEEAAQPAPERKYTAYERKLRRKYKLDKDPLLSGNDAVPGFVIAKGERVIRSYDCLSTGKGDGILCLTNRRLLINAGERSEIDIDKVSGIKFSKYTNFSFFKFLFWLVFFGLGVFMLLLPSFNSGMNIPGITGDSWKSWFTYLFYGCGAVSVLISLPFFFKILKKTFYFYVYAREEAPFLEYKSRAYAKREKKGKVYKYTISKAGSESEKAARELGALIIEAKEGRYDD